MLPLTLATIGPGVYLAMVKILSVFACGMCSIPWLIVSVFVGFCQHKDNTKAASTLPDLIGTFASIVLYRVDLFPRSARTVYGADGPPAARVRPRIP